MNSEEFEPIEEETYGFGPREGKIVEDMFITFHQFAHKHDISLPELLGVIQIASGLLTQTMVRYVPGYDDFDSDIPTEEV